MYVNKVNFHEIINDVKNNPKEYQDIARKGREVAERWTSDRFADFIYNHAKEKLNGCN